MSTQFDGSFGGYEKRKNDSSLPWNQVWMKAITSPSEATYEEIISDPNANLSRAFTWIALTSVLGSIISIVFALCLFSLNIGAGAFPTSDASQFGSVLTPSTGAMLGGLGIFALCSIPFSAVLAVVGLVITSGAANIIAKSFFNGQGTFEQLTYSYSAILSPITLISIALSAIPVVGACLSLPLALYSLYLQGLSVRTVHRLDWGPSLISALALPIVLIILGVCGIIAFFSFAVSTVGSGLR